VRVPDSDNQIDRSTSIRVKNIVTLAVAASLYLGASLAGATAAFADASGTSGQGCTATSYTPYKAASSQIYGSGYVSCTSATTRSVFIEVHRSEGWWHPVVATHSFSSWDNSYSISAQGCDNNRQGVFFTEVRTGSNAEINSGDSTTLSANCPA